MIDPGLMTDSSGEGEYGAHDVSLRTQQQMKNTYYNGSKPCLECGLTLAPQVILQGKELCPKCQNRRDYGHVQNRMVSR